MNNLAILALDPATKTGWALHTTRFLLSLRDDEDKQPIHEVTSGTWDLANKKKRDEFEPDLRFSVMYSNLEALAKKHGLQAIYYEHVMHHVSSQNAHIYGGLLGIIHLVATAYGIPVIGAKPTEIKKHMTGRGGASKVEMIHAAKQKLGRDVVDDNEADALALLDLALTRDYGMKGVKV